MEVTVTVEDVNEAPTITTTSKTAFSYRENGTATIYTFRATDPERSAIAWSVSGTDEDDFAISETGVLSFASSPDYESPTDSGRDNVYEVTVVAKDDAFNSGTLDVVVTVTDQNEGPEDIGAAEPIVHREPDYGAGAGHLHGHRPRGPVCPHNALEPDRYRRGRLHHQRERPADLPERPGPRASRRTPGATTSTTSPSVHPTGGTTDTWRSPLPSRT